MVTDQFKPLIVTATLDDSSFELFDALRKEHFPPERNFLRAHLTLFHHLPGEDVEEIADTLSRIAAATRPPELLFSSWRSLGRGVAMNVDSPELHRVRKQIVDSLTATLTRQDKQPFRPHITVQNKVEPEQAKTLLAELTGERLPPNGFATGLRLSKYLGGPWEEVETFDFRNG